MLRANRTILRWSLLFTLLVSACGDDGGETSVPGPMSPGPSPPAGAQPPASQAAPASARYDDVVELVVRNQTRRIVYQLYISPSAVDRWGPDLLGSNVLAPGQTVSFESDYCDAYYDLLAVDINGATVARANRIYFDCGIRESITLL